VAAELPADVPGFTGRDAELATLDALIDPDVPMAGTAIISAVSGTAGVGKTALAVRWAWPTPTFPSNSTPARRPTAPRSQVDAC
jgi:hypothetical protein